MDLLPRVSSEFSSSSYWESFFTKRKHSFEWYGNYMELCAILHRYIKAKDDILVAGCGNSELSEKLYDSGFSKITNIDITKSVIEQMRRKNKQREEMKWLEMDLTSMDLEDGSFSVVLDKGTLDALMSDASDDANEKVRKIFVEISRVLRFGGRYICISLAQDHILNALIKFFPPNSWMLRMHKVWTGELCTDEGGLDMPVFAFVLTKFKDLPKKIFEVCLEDGIKPTRLQSEKEVVELVKTQQYYALMRRKLSRDGDTEQPLCITLYSSENIDIPRYTMHVIDMRNHKLCNKFGVFIVPKGREREWLFSTEEGRRQVAESAQFKRLVFASLSRDHLYEGMQQIQDELSAKVMELAPIKLPRTYKAPFLSVNNDLGEVRIRHEGQSSLTGSYLVEDYIGEGGWWYRQLVINSAAKTTVKLKEVQKRKKKNRQNKEDFEMSVDPSCFASQYAGAVITGISNLVESIDAKFSVLLLGVKGGAIPLHLLHCFKHCDVIVVEEDMAMIEVANKWFDLANSRSVERIHFKNETLDNFLPFLLSDKVLFDVIILNTNENSFEAAIPVINESTLTNVVNLLSNKGVFMTWVAKRRSEETSKIIPVFPHQYLIKCGEEISDVLVCSNSTLNDEDWKRKARKLERSSKNNLELSEYFDDILKIS